MLKKKLLGTILVLTLTATLVPYISTPALAEGETFSSISTGTYHSAAIKSDGSLWMWGWNIYGELGDGTTTDRSVPVKVMDSVKAVSASWHYTMAIKTDGSLWAWGYNQYGKIGINSTIPVKIMDDVIAVSAGAYYAMAIKNDGSLWGWGYGYVGAGTGATLYYPVKVMDGVAYVSAGEFHAMIIKTDGNLWAWGSNSNGQLGDGTTIDRSIPVKVMDDVASVSVDDNYTMAIKTDGSLWAWGENRDGILGNGTRTTYKYYSPEEGVEFPFVDENNDSAIPVKVMDDVAYVSAGHQCAMAIKTDSSLWAWGCNYDGWLGDGTETTADEDNDRLFPIMIMDGVAAVSAGSFRSMAVKSDGSLWGWGLNSYALIINDSESPITTPVKMMNDILLPGQTPSVTAHPTTSTVIVNGKTVTFDAYNINDNNYFKLRDIAYILSGTNKQFEVTWDGASNAILLISGVPYTAVGGEMQGKGAGDKTLYAATPKILLDGKNVAFTAYTVEDNNYFKLRDMAQALDFGITWDGATNKITIDTSVGYSPA